jgi:hypothetical protein
MAQQLQESSAANAAATPQAKLENLRLVHLSDCILQFPREGQHEDLHSALGPLNKLGSARQP